MRTIIVLFLVCSTAIGLGLFSTWYVMERGLFFGLQQSGPWQAWPGAGAPDADPYTKAYLAREGAIWLGSSEGIALYANTDSSGQPLVSTCSYRISGEIPRSRAWTLVADARTSAAATVHDELGAPITPGVLHSSSVIWTGTEKILIEVSKDIQTGNWLAMPNRKNVRIVLRLYDTPLVTSGFQENLQLPTIERVRCAT